jgi:hypothetical protein
VNTTFFDPALHKPLEDLESRARLVWGAGRADEGKQRLRARRLRQQNGRLFRFVSSFKWETRKVGG